MAKSKMELLALFIANGQGSLEERVRSEVEENARFSIGAAKYILCAQGPTIDKLGWCLRNPHSGGDKGTVRIWFLASRSEGDFMFSALASAGKCSLWLFYNK